MIRRDISRNIRVLVMMLSISTGVRCVAQDNAPDTPADPASAETDEHLIPPRDLPSLIEIAQTNSPTLKRLEAFVDNARGLRQQATRQQNPFVGYQAQEIGNEGQFGQHGFYWSQTWLTAGKPELAGEVAGWTVQKRGWDYETERHRVANRVRTRYYNLLAARRVSQLAQQFRVIAATNVASVTRLHNAGEIPRNQLLQARIELGKASVDAENAATSLEYARELLLIVTAADKLSFKEIQGDLLAAVPRLDRTELLVSLLDSSPQIEAARAVVQQSKWRINLAVAQPEPNVNTQFGVLYDDSTSSTITNLQVGWQIPTRNQNTGNIRAARAESRRATHALRELELQLRERLAVAFRDYETAAQRARAYEQDLLPMAKDNLKITQTAYRIGEASYQTLLTAQRSYFETAMATVEARRVLWLAIAQIQGLVIPES